MDNARTVEACGLGDVFRRRLSDESKLAKAANQEMFGTSARAGTRNDEAASEDKDKAEEAIKKEVIKKEVIKKEEKLDHDHNEPTKAATPSQSEDNPTSSLHCADCNLDITVPVEKQKLRYSAMDLNEYFRSGSYSREA